MENKKIVWKYIFTLGLIFAILLLGRVYIDMKHYDMILKTREDLISQNIENQFKNSQDYLIDKYSLLSKQLMNNNLIYKYFKNDSRDKLYEILKKDYEDFKLQDKNLYVLHFINKDNITVLRMHKPASFHDDLSKKRPIVSYVNKVQKTQNGFEAGKNGIVYRITTAFKHNDEYLGVLEFGIKPKYFVDILDKQFDIKSQILVKTSKLNVLLAKKNYPKVGEYSIASNDPFFDKISSKIDITKDRQIIEYQDKTYILFNNLNLKDFEGNTISKVLMLKDITSILKENNSSLMIINSLTLMVFVFVLMVLYIVLSKFCRDIEEHTLTITNLHKRSEYLQNKANTDDLTSIFNKRYFDWYFKSFIDKNRLGSIIFFDIDHFKKINDTYGHLAGDEILKQLCNTIKTFMRDEDTFVRWGGEEFIILFEDLNINIASQKADEIRKVVEKTKFFNNIEVTISLGVTNIIIDDTVDRVLKRVDKLLYIAKDSGRNRVEYKIEK